MLHFRQNNAYPWSVAVAVARVGTASHWGQCTCVKHGVLTLQVSSESPFLLFTLCRCLSIRGRVPTSFLGTTFTTKSSRGEGVGFLNPGTWTGHRR